MKTITITKIETKPKLVKEKYTGKKGGYTKTQQGNFMKVHPLDR